jgi:hypothetical protein
VFVGAVDIHGAADAVDALTGGLELGQARWGQDTMDVGI